MRLTDSSRWQVMMVHVELADLSTDRHQAAFLAMTRMYACDAMGNGGELPEEVMQRLVPALKDHPTALIFLAFDQDQPVGIATCFLGFSTFAAKPLINIHDFAVHPIIAVSVSVALSCIRSKLKLVSWAASK